MICKMMSNGLVLEEGTEVEKNSYSIILEKELNKPLPGAWIVHQYLQASEIREENTRIAIGNAGIFISTFPAARFPKGSI